MFDLEEINLMPDRVPDKKATPGADAIARAKAIQCGAKWKCTRVKAWVSIDDCVGRYALAREDKSGDYQPCLECSSIVLHLRNMGKGLPSPISMQTPPMSAPRFEPKPLPKPKETTMARPAKKGTPDPIVVETKEEPHRLEIVAAQQCETKPVAPQKKETVSHNPFEGWTKFNPRDHAKPGDVYARIGKTSMSFSAAASAELSLILYDSVDVYHADGKLGLHFRMGKAGTFVLTKEPRSKAVRKLSCSSLVKSLKLDNLGAIDRRLALKRLAPGMIEIDLKSEAAA